MAKVEKNSMSQLLSFKFTKLFSRQIISLQQVSISPTFYEQLLCQKSFRQKITNPNCKHIKAAQKTFIQKAAHKI
jgi:hypothetical protein